MKKQVLVLSLIFLFFSCSEKEEIIGYEEKVLAKNKIEKASLKEQINYVNKHLLNVGKIISKAFRKKNVKNEIIASVKSNYNLGFDSEVFIKDLLDKGILDKVLDKEEKLLLDQSLNAFYNLDNEDWHVKIFMPFFENQITKKLMEIYNQSSLLRSKIYQTQ